MPRVELEGAVREGFGAPVVAVLLVAERVHRKHARVPRHRGTPLRQHLRDAVAQHAPPAEPEVEGVRDDEGQEVLRLVDDDRAVTLERIARVAREPGARRKRVTAGVFAVIGNGRFDCDDALGERLASPEVAPGDDVRRPQAVRRDAGGIAGEQVLDLGHRIAAMRVDEQEDVLAAPDRVGISRRGAGHRGGRGGRSRHDVSGGFGA